ncbi:sugar-transfer associated ATP-grasp domain-containing protein [Parapedobacter deserti]|uniref:Sugar-transfer associated ATP-grasp domain-containing protein n=1 Tax=Parapedobacter deserti TaxID=1912957 RepID=A0ABV7JHH6_9SPHI
MKRKAIKNLVQKYLTYEYHKSLNNSAIETLKSIESIKGKTDARFIKLSNEYAGDILGWRGYAPWLYVYSAIAGSFKEGWIPDNYYGKIVVPALKGQYGKIGDLKSLTNKLFNENIFPDLLYYTNGLFFTTDYCAFPPEKIKEYVFRDSNKVVFKKDNSGRGFGISIFDESNFDVNKIKTLGDGVIQEYIKQHAFFKAFMPNSVATIRITTAIDDYGSCTARACFLRLGRSKDTHINSESRILIPVNLETGALHDQGFMPNWNLTDRHPDTGTLFAKKQIPNFAKCISTAVALHKSMPLARCIGWDMIVDENDDVKIMEWNGNHNGIKFSEATQGPCFSDLGWENLWRTSK